MGFLSRHRQPEHQMADFKFGAQGEPAGGRISVYPNVAEPGYHATDYPIVMHCDVTKGCDSPIRIHLSREEAIKLRTELMAQLARQNK
jgi:hypothetical protein